MTVEMNKANARRFIDEVVNRGNVAVIDELASPNYVDHTTPPGMPGGAEGQKAFVTMFRAAFPDLHYTIDDTIAEGDRLVQRNTAHGTMKGDFMGMPASGKEATWSEIHIVRFDDDGKALEHWGVVDQLGMLAQLGFAQAPGQPAGVSG
jgi:steroid delta-isomerase-like uncharacterized protein